MGAARRGSRGRCGTDLSARDARSQRRGARRGIGPTARSFADARSGASFDDATAVAVHPSVEAGLASSVEAGVAPSFEAGLARSFEAGIIAAAPTTDPRGALVAAGAAELLGATRERTTRARARTRATADDDDARSRVGAHLGT